MPRLKFKEVEYVLVNGDDNRIEGAIATEEDYENFALGYAHLMEDGTIMRFGEIIGTIADIEWLN